MVRRIETEVKIPEGYVFDKENSTEENIKIKPKVTIEEIHYQNNNDNVIHCSTKYANKISTYLKLLEISDYLNGDWTPDWNKKDGVGWAIRVSTRYNELIIETADEMEPFVFYFKDPKLAQLAIDTVGEENIENLYNIQKD